MSGARQNLTVALLVVLLVFFSGCGMFGQQSDDDVSTATQTSTATTKTAAAITEEPQVGAEIELDAVLLSGSQLAPPFALSYEVSRPETHTGTPAPEGGATNRFINQEIEDGEAIIIQSTVARYETAADAKSGLRSSAIASTGSDGLERRSGNVLGVYRITNFQNEQGYKVTVLYHRYGNVVHGVIVTGGSDTETTALELAQLQHLQLRRLVE